MNNEGYIEKGKEENLLGKEDMQKALLYQIMKVEFGVTETTLYLDTHPFDQRALMHHNMLSNQLKGLIQQYEYQYGPLTSSGSAYRCWKYINSPWPWEIKW